MKPEIRVTRNFWENNNQDVLYGVEVEVTDSDGNKRIQQIEGEFKTHHSLMKEIKKINHIPIEIKLLRVL